jgi:two-component system LytT family response regulator
MSRNLKEFEEILPDKEFFKIHESHIINLSCPKNIFRGKGEQVMLSDAVLDVARRRKENFLKHIGNK